MRSSSCRPLQTLHLSQYIAPAPAVSHVVLVLGVEYIAPPASYGTLAPLVEYNAPAASYATLAPVDEDIASVSAVDATLVLVVEYIPPAPVGDAAPAPAFEYITPAPVGFAATAPVDEYIALVLAVEAPPAHVVESCMPAPVGRYIASARCICASGVCKYLHLLLNTSPRCQPCAQNLHPSGSTPLQLPQCLTLLQRRWWTCSVHSSKMTLPRPAAKPPPAVVV